jgi:arsenical pump membrane protein
MVDAGIAIARQWDVFLFLLGLMGTAAIVEQSGVVEHLAVLAERQAHGRRDLLLVLVSGVAVLVTATLSNDATVLILTPLVIAMCGHLRVPVLPYALACALLANTASLLLPVANPANILVLHDAPLRLDTFVTLLLVPAIVAIVATVAGLAFVFRAELRGDVVGVERPADAPDALPIAIGLAVIVVAYLVALAYGWPVGLVAVSGAAALLALRMVRGRLQARRYLDGIEWEIFPFLAGLLVLVAAAERGGLAGIVRRVFTEADAAGTAGLVGLGVATAFASNVMNNLPLAVVMGSGLRDGADVARHTIGAVLIGVDLGPNFTTVGSLATMLWLLILRRRGAGISSAEYLRRAWLPSLLGLAAAITALAVASSVT